MATYTIYATGTGNDDDGQVQSQGTTYSTVRSGDTLYADATGTGAVIGQRLQAATYYCYEYFLAFPTGAVIPANETITSSVLSVWIGTDTSTTDFIMEARGRQWVGTLDVADWVPGANISAETLLASITTLGIGTGLYSNLTQNGTNLNSAINRSGVTHMMMSSDRLASGQAPAGDEFVNIVAAEATGTTQDPKLVVTTAVTYSGSLTADANIKTTIPASFTADAFVQNVQSGSFASDAFVLRVQAGSFTASGYIKRSAHTKSFTTDAYIIGTGTMVRTATPDASLGTCLVRVTRTPATTVTSAKLYRQNPFTLDWYLLTSQPANFYYTDVSCPLGLTYSYRVDEFDASLALLSQTTISGVLVQTDEWFMATDATGAISVSVDDAQQKRPRQQEDFAVLVLPYKAVQTGELLSWAGTISFTVPEASRMATLRSLRAMSREAARVWLKSPFGRVYEVSVGGQTIEYLPGGAVSVSIPFIQTGEA